ncbi:hypothetical protein CYMTET_38621 [Cymbomonas tetramitiformis]|uniref:Uncharacterized protein n=1 Tax=Cymbomonas tetramitiformis TaxID=36881 RepID=A0AAE0CCW7_9CHLO|nr:hypothetical protein CYMTET_38621 [Cymbomonas tetramitiformis]
MENLMGVPPIDNDAQDIVVNAWDNRSFIGNGGRHDHTIDGFVVANAGGANANFINDSYLHNHFFHEKPLFLRIPKEWNIIEEVDTCDEEFARWEKDRHVYIDHKVATLGQSFLIWYTLHHKLTSARTHASRTANSTNGAVKVSPAGEVTYYHDEEGVLAASRVSIEEDAKPVIIYPGSVTSLDWFEQRSHTITLSRDREITTPVWVRLDKKKKRVLEELLNLADTKNTRNLEYRSCDARYGFDIDDCGFDYIKGPSRFPRKLKCKMYEKVEIEAGLLQALLTVITDRGTHRSM